MFAIDCPRHGRKVLLGPSHIRSLGPAPDGGFVIGYRCTCGYEGEWPPAGLEPEGRWDERMAG